MVEIIHAKARNNFIDGRIGLFPRKVKLSKQLERIVEKESFPISEAEIVPGKEFKVTQGDGYSFFLTDGRIRITSPEGETIYFERIKIVIEDGKYTPMELHPVLKDRMREFTRLNQQSYE